MPESSQQGLFAGRSSRITPVQVSADPGHVLAVFFEKDTEHAMWWNQTEEGAVGVDDSETASLAIGHLRCSGLLVDTGDR